MCIGRPDPEGDQEVNQYRVNNLTTAGRGGHKSPRRDFLRSIEHCKTRFNVQFVFFASWISPLQAPHADWIALLRRTASTAARAPLIVVMQGHDGT
jgi:hypothetical protein